MLSRLSGIRSAPVAGNSDAKGAADKARLAAEENGED